MSFWYTYGLEDLAHNGFEGQDMRAILVMTNTTADTEEDTQHIADFTILDRCDGAGYADLALGGEIATAVLAANQAALTANPFTFPLVSVGSRQIAGLIIFRFVTGDADSIPWLYIDTSTGPTPFPFWTNGANVVVTPAAGGLATVTRV